MSSEIEYDIKLDQYIEYLDDLSGSNNIKKAKVVFFKIFDRFVELRNKNKKIASGQIAEIASIAEQFEYDYMQIQLYDYLIDGADIGYGYILKGQYFEKKSKFEYAENMYQKAMNYGDEYKLYAYKNLGYMYDYKDDVENAIEYYENVLEIEIDPTIALYLGSIYERKDNLERALEMTKLSYENGLPNYMIEFNLGVIYGRLKNYVKAERHYIESIRLNPNYGYSYLNLAVQYRTLGNYKFAIKILKKGINNNQDESYLHYNIACYYAHENDLEKSAHHIGISLSLNSKLKVEACGDSDLKLLRDNEIYKSYFIDD